MLLKKWDDINPYIKNDEVKKYYDALQKKKISLILKRISDIILAVLILIVLLPAIIVISIIIKCDSKGEIYFRQERVTKYGKIFKIFKFRTMVTGAQKMGSQVTVENDSRITKVGKFLRKYRLDEFPQLYNIIMGDMTFVGTRPEVFKYVEKYTDEMKATLLMPAGVTSLASIEFKDEEKLLNKNENIDEIYINEVLPKKMKYNLQYMQKFNFIYDIILMIKTFFAVLK